MRWPLVFRKNMDYQMDYQCFIDQLQNTLSKTETETTRDIWHLRDVIKGLKGEQKFTERATWDLLNDMTKFAHERNKKWWYTKDGKKIDRNKGELLALIHSEISEVLEGVRKDMQDEKLPHRKAEEVELVDALIRIFDYAGAFGLDLSGAMIEKNEYNAKRADHTYEHREGKHGKKF